MPSRAAAARNNFKLLLDHTLTPDGASGSTVAPLTGNWRYWNSLDDSNYLALAAPLGSRGLANVGRLNGQCWFVLTSQGGALLDRSRYILSSESASPTPYGFSLYTALKNTQIEFKLRGPTNQWVMFSQDMTGWVNQPMHAAWSLHNGWCWFWLNGVLSAYGAIPAGNFSPGVNDITVGRRPQPTSTNNNGAGGVIGVMGWSCGSIGLGAGSISTGFFNEADIDVATAYLDGLVKRDIVPLAGSKTEHLYSAKAEGAVNAAITDQLSGHNMARVGTPTLASLDLSWVTVPSTASVTVPSSTLNAMPDAIVTLTGSASGGGPSSTMLQFMADGEPISGVLFPSFTPSFSWDLALERIGPRAVTVRAVNYAGQVVSSSREVFIEAVGGIGTKVGQGQDPTTTLSRMVQLGVNWYREGINWSLLEATTPGVYDWGSTRFAALETIRDNALTYGIRMTWVLAYGNGFWGNPAMEEFARAPYAAMAKAVVQRHGTKVRNVSIWNEFPGGLGLPGNNYLLGTTDRYLDLCKVTTPKIREGYAREIIGGPVNVNDTNYEQRWMRMFASQGGGDYFDWLDLHIYPNYDPTRRPENGARWIRDQLAPCFPDKPVLISEYGFSCYTALHTQARKAEEVARFFFACRAYIPKLKGIIWYELRDGNSAATTTKESQYGLCESDSAMTPLPAFWTMQDILPLFIRGKFYGRGAYNASTHILKWRDGSGDVYVAWREENGDANLNFQFNSAVSGNLAVRPVKQSSAAPGSALYPYSPGTNIVWSIPLTTNPVFIRPSTAITISPTYGFSPVPI